VLQITSAQQHIPIIHYILPHLKLNRTGGSTHWRRSTKHDQNEAQKSTDSQQGYDAATTSNQKQRGAHLHDYIHPQPYLKGCPHLLLDDSLKRTASPGASFAPKRTFTLGSLNEPTMSTRLHTAPQVNAAHYCAAARINLLHKLTK